MKVNLKIIILIVISIAVSFLDGFFVIKAFHGANDSSPAAFQKQQELESSFQSVSSALKNLESKKPLKINLDSSLMSSSADSTNSASLIKENLKLRILNATGITGYANSLKDKLKSLGIFEDISLGNAPATSSSVLNSKKSLPASYLDSIMKIVKNDLPEIKNGSLPDSDRADIEIIMGSR